MKQKLAVARAVFHRPSLVFLDEPTSGLDPVATVGLREDLAALAEHEGVTVFLTTHNLNEAERLCARVGVIRAGKLLAVGSPDELRASRDAGRVHITARGITPDVVSLLRARAEVTDAAADDGRLTLGLTPQASVAPIVTLLVHHGVEVEEVRRARASLEDTFLDLMRVDGSGAQNGGRL